MICESLPSTLYNAVSGPENGVHFTPTKNDSVRPEPLHASCLTETAFQKVQTVTNARQIQPPH
jgi:hypothetical protein